MRRRCSVVRFSVPFCSMIDAASAASAVPNAFSRFSSEARVPLPESV